MLHGSALFAVKILSEVFNLLLVGKIPTAAFDFLIFLHCHNFVLYVYKIEHEPSSCCRQ